MLTTDFTNSVILSAVESKSNCIWYHASWDSPYPKHKQPRQAKRQLTDTGRALQKASEATSGTASGLSILDPHLCQATARVSFKEKLKQCAPSQKMSPV